MTEIPVIVTLCGSSRYKEAYIQANKRETLAGKIVLSIGMFGHEEGIDMDGPVKAMLDALHLKKVELADEVLILDQLVPWCDHCQEFRVQTMGCSGECAWNGTLRPYIGPSTRRELEHACRLGKKVRFLSEESRA